VGGEREKEDNLRGRKRLSSFLAELRKLSSSSPTLVLSAFHPPSRSPWCSPFEPFPLMREATAARPALGARGAAPSSARPAAAAPFSARKILGASSPSSGGLTPAPLQRVRAISTEQPPVVGEAFYSYVRPVAQTQGKKEERGEKSVDLFFLRPFFLLLLVRPPSAVESERERDARPRHALSFSTSTLFSLPPLFCHHRPSLPFPLSRREAGGTRSQKNQLKTLEKQKTKTETENDSGSRTSCRRSTSRCPSTPPSTIARLPPRALPPPSARASSSWAPGGGP